ncbi:GNAT family N-acetyltransferase [Brevibacterium salitolerans]|uniref:N-acetyltransferase domain-containing protein n=1 Tax=Brevibacterium salitolerans TaxID=1403566 RepID=A0ABP5IN52_9MICO
MNGIELRKAQSDEAEEVSAVALRSKGYWGYSDAFLAACRAELTFTPEQCRSGALIVAESDRCIVGFYLLDGSPPEGELAALFVDPVWIGAGVGGALLRHALTKAAELGFRCLVLDADPGAESFYAKYGAETIGSVASGSIPGRQIPQMRFDLT